MNPGAVLFPTMYEMLIGMLKLSKYRCFIDIRLNGWRRRRLRRLCAKIVEVMRGEKARVWSAPFGSDKNGRFLAFSWSGRAPVGTGGLVYMLGLIGIDFGLFPDTFVF